MRPEQIRAARGYLDCSRVEMASQTGVSAETIKNIETGRFVPRAKTAESIRNFFRCNGIGFFELQGGLTGVVLDPMKSEDGLKFSKLTVQEETIPAPVGDTGANQG